MAIIGLRDTEGFATDLRETDYRKALLLLYRHGVESKATLTALSSMMKTRVVTDPEFHWWEKEVSTRRLCLHATTGDLEASEADQETNLVASSDANYVDAREFKEGDMFLVEETGEVIQLNSDPTSDTVIRFNRSIGAVAATILDANGAGKNPFLRFIGSAYEEGSSAPTGTARDPTKKTNYCQIHRESLEFTNTAINTTLRTKADVSEAQREALEKLAVGMEMASLFGEKLETTKNGKPLRYSGGILSFMPSANIANLAASTVTMSVFEEHLKAAFKYGSSEKIAWMGDRALLTIQQIARLNSSYNIQNGIKEYGINVSRLTTPFGELVLKRHALLSDSPGGTTTAVAYYGMDAWMWIMDMAALKYVHLSNRDIKYERDQQTPGLDGEKSGYIAETSYEVTNGAAHYLIKGLRGAAAG